MNINTAIQSFSSLNGIKVTQNGNTTKDINKSKNSEEISININSKTLNTLNLLSSLEKQTFLKAYDRSYTNPDTEAANKKLKKHYKKMNEENKSFPNPEQHIWNKYHNPKYEYYAKDMNRIEREIAYNQELSQLEGRYQSFHYDDYSIKNMKAVNHDVDVAQEKAYYRDKVNNQFQQLLDKYGIEMPKDKNISFTIDPYDYKVNVSGIEDKSLASLLEDVLNTADNSKELFSHIYKSTNDNNSQITLEKNEKSRIFHEIKEKTGYDLRDLENKDGKFLTPDGTDILEPYKQAIIKSKDIPEEYKGLVYESYAKKLNEVAKKGFENVPDMFLSIDYKNGSFYDIGQSENFGTGKTKWIDELKASKPQTWAEAFRTDKYSIDNENKQNIIQEALNLKEVKFSAVSFDGKSLFEKYGNNIELMKLELMQKYLLGKDNSEMDKKFYEFLKEWEDNKVKEIT
ncbi:hypothetical protein CRU92_10635 [Arcobacter sp. FW59]|nr:hypothetical protein CRU92_10635 [Arcobacter sp. FW59]